MMMMRHRDKLAPAAGLPKDHFDILVIGSGMGGLTSALILAKEGYRVCVVEQHYRPGGCLHRFFRKKIPFDTGFHYLGGVDGDGTFAKYLRYLGVYDKLRFNKLDPDGFDLLRFPGFEFNIPCGWDRLVPRLLETFPKEKAAIHRYAEVCQRICADSPAYSFKMPSELSGEFTNTALGPFLRSLTPDPRLRAVLTAQGMLYGIEPENTPLELHALVLDSMLQGAAGLDGGGDALAKAMVDAIRAHGGVVRTRAKVVELKVQDGYVTAARLEKNDELIHTRAVVSNAHPKLTLDLLPDGAMRGGYPARIRGMRESISCIGGYFVSHNTTAPPRRHNLYCYPDVDIDEMYRSAVFSESAGPEKAVFLTFPSDRETDWSGPRVILALGLMPWDAVAKYEHTRSGERGPEYEALKAHYGRQLQRAVEHALPEHGGFLECVEISTPLTNRDYTLTPNGAIYGLRHSMDQWGKYALHPRTRIDNLLLTGQSVLMPGVLGVTVGGFVTCAFLVGFEHLFDKVARA